MAPRSPPPLRSGPAEPGRSSVSRRARPPNQKLPCRPWPPAKRAAPSRVSPESIVALPSANSRASAASRSQPGSLVDGAAIAEHAARRERRDLARERLRRGPRLAHRDHAIGETDSLGLAGVYGTAREDQVECAAHADQAGQSDVAAVDQRHAPAPAEDAEDRVLLDDAQVAPERELEAAGHRVAGDGGDHRLGQQHPARPHGPVARRRDPSCRARCRWPSGRRRRRTCRPRPTARRREPRCRPRTDGRPPPAPPRWAVHRVAGLGTVEQRSW